MVGNPELNPDEEKKFRRGVVERAIQAISVEISDPQVF